MWEFNISGQTWDVSQHCALTYKQSHQFPPLGFDSHTYSLTITQAPTGQVSELTVVGAGLDIVLKGLHRRRCSIDD